MVSKPKKPRFYCSDIFAYRFLQATIVEEIFLLGFNSSCSSSYQAEQMPVQFKEILGLKDLIGDKIMDIGKKIGCVRLCLH